MSFEHAPVTKGLMMTCALSSLFVGLFDIKHYFHIQFVPHISRHHQYWRLFSHHLSFTSSSDLFLFEILLYNAGIYVERQFGSLKYASFIFVSTLLATLLEFVTLILFHRVGINHISMGASTVLFAIIYQYSRIVPEVYTYKVFGLPLNNKSMNYFLALQLACSHPPVSLVVGALGVLSGQIYRSDLASLNTYRLPRWIVSFSSRFLGPLVGSLRPPRRSNRAMPEESRDSIAARLMELNDEVVTTARTPRTPPVSGDPASARPEGSASMMREWVDELTGRGDRANAGLRVPPEEEISHLTAMFPTLEREVVVGALQRSANIEGAVETLLSSQN